METTYEGTQYPATPVQKSNTWKWVVGIILAIVLSGCSFQMGRQYQEEKDVQCIASYAQTGSTANCESSGG